jgi:hypothetical protein
VLDLLWLGVGLLLALLAGTEEVLVHLEDDVLGEAAGDLRREEDYALWFSWPGKTPTASTRALLPRTTTCLSTFPVRPRQSPERERNPVRPRQGLAPAL